MVAGVLSFPLLTSIFDVSEIYAAKLSGRRPDGRAVGRLLQRVSLQHV